MIGLAHYGLTIERLREMLRYDPDTGEFTWLIRPARCMQIGDKAGGVDTNGYLAIRVLKRLIPGHRLAFFLMGEDLLPHETVDHKNTITHDNRWDNLRKANSSEQKGNTRRMSRNTSGYKGVSKSRHKWRANIMKDGVKYELGTYDTPEAAYAAYTEAASKLFGEFARVA